MTFRSVSPIDLDCLVVGHGSAGLLCASRLAFQGIKVGLVGEGETSTSLSSGCITTIHPVAGDLIEGRELQSRFPFSLGGESWEETLEILEELFPFLLSGLDDQGLPLRGNPLMVSRMLTNLGTPYQCSVGQLHSLPGTIDHVLRGDTALLGIMGHRDSDPDLAAAMVRSTLNLDVRPYWTMPSSLEGRTDMTPGEVARLAKKGRFIGELAEALSDIGEERIGIPPVFDLADYERGMNLLRDSSGREVFELITPLSLPGRRLQAALESLARSEGCRMLLGWRASSIEESEGEVNSVVLESRSRTMRVEPSTLVLATGDTVGGGLSVKGQSIREALLSSSGSNVVEGLSTLDANDLLRLSREGVEVDQGLHIVGKDGAMSNAFAAGAIISGFSYPSGEGMGASLFTAWLAARAVMEVLG
jgi:glycerol-3-phosphate dehydrogenase subunit B